MRRQTMMMRAIHRLGTMTCCLGAMACSDDDSAGSDTSAETRSETVSEITSETVSEITSETVSEITSETVSEITSETTSETTPVPDSLTHADSDAVAEHIEIAGDWTTQFGDESISDTAWTGFAPQIVVSYDNSANVAITQNPADASFAPNTYSRIVWTEPADNAFYYCTTTYGQATAEAASTAAETGIDRADLDGKGCAGFPWSHLTRK